MSEWLFYEPTYLWLFEHIQIINFIIENVIESINIHNCRVPKHLTFSAFYIFPKLWVNLLYQVSLTLSHIYTLANLFISLGVSCFFLYFYLSYIVLRQPFFSRNFVYTTILSCVMIFLFLISYSKRIIDFTLTNSSFLQSSCTLYFSLLFQVSFKHF